MNDPAWQDHHNANYGPEDVPGPNYGSLIERLEKATGPDSDLDGDIAVSEGLYARRPVVCVPPAYTSSIDAALTLAPAGWYGRIFFGDRPPNIEKEYEQAALWNSDHMRRESVIGCGGRGPTLAIAICIAALKARSVA